MGRLHGRRLRRVRPRPRPQPRRSVLASPTLPLAAEGGGRISEELRRHVRAREHARRAWRHGRTEQRAKRPAQRPATWSPSGAEAALAQGPKRRESPNYRRLERADLAARACTRSARRRTARTSASAGARHGDVHDPGRGLHAPLRLLRRQDGAPGPVDRAEPRRVADAVPAMGLRHASSRRSTATTCRTAAPALFAATIARDPRASARLRGRGADARLPGPGSAGRCSTRARTSSTTTSRRCRACTAGAARLRLPALLPRAAASRQAMDADADDQERHHGRAWAKRARSCSSDRDPRGTRTRSSPSASTCGPRAEHLPVARYCTPTSSRSSSARPTRSASHPSPRARWCAALPRGRAGADQAYIRRLANHPGCVRGRGRSSWARTMASPCWLHGRA